MTSTALEFTLPPLPASTTNSSPPSACDQPRAPPIGAKYAALTDCSTIRLLVWQPLPPLQSTTPVTLNTPAASSQYISYCWNGVAPAKKLVVSPTKVWNLILSMAAKVRVRLVYFIKRPSALTSV